MARERLHTRSITLHGFLRDDGLYELEASLEDVKSYDSKRFPAEILPAGQPLHGMGVRMVFDAGMRIHAFSATMTATPYDGCRDAAPNFERLAGLTIQPGFLREATRRVAGVDGCTHLRELLQQVATAAYQTAVGDRLRKADGPEDPPQTRPKQIDSCTGYRADGEWVGIRWPAFHRPRSTPPQAGE